MEVTDLNEAKAPIPAVMPFSRTAVSNSGVCRGKAASGNLRLCNNKARLCIALAAGSIIIRPICVMSLGRPLTKNILTLSVCTIIFAAGPSFGTKTTNVETLIATAT